MVFPWRFARYVDIILQVCCKKKKIENCCSRRQAFSLFQCTLFLGKSRRRRTSAVYNICLLRHFPFLGVGKQPILSINHFLPSLWHFLQPVVFILVLFFFKSTFKHFKILLLLVLEICLYQLFMLFNKLYLELFWNSVFFLSLAFLFPLFILLKYLMSSTLSLLASVHL